MPWLKVKHNITIIESESIDFAVIAGTDETGYFVNDVEVVRIHDNGSISSSLCSIPPYPEKVRTPGGVVTEDGKVILCGGMRGGTGDVLDSCYRFNEETWAWEELESMISGRNIIVDSMTSNKRSVYVAGGNSGSASLDKAEKYENGSWYAISSLPAPVFCNCLVTIPNDKLLSIGGFNTQSGRVRILP